MNPNLFKLQICDGKKKFSVYIKVKSKSIWSLRYDSTEYLKWEDMSPTGSQVESMKVQDVPEAFGVSQAWL
jgi:hypothetical protein